MAQQYYNLEEAAAKLGISADELREMAKKKELRAFQDKGNWRFRAQEIDERARQRGAGSDPDLALGEAPAKPRPAAPQDSGRLAVDFQIDDVVPLGNEKASAGPASGRGAKTPAPKSASDSDVRLVIDESIDINVDSDVKLDGAKSGPRRGADSGVRLDKGIDSDVKLVEESKAPSDSDIRLQDAGTKKKGSDANIITEEIDLDAEAARLEAKAKATKGGKPIKPRATTQYNPNMPVLPTSSPYELSENDMGLDDAPPKPKKGRSPVEDTSSEHEMIAFDPDKARQDLGSGDIPLLAGDEDVDLGELPAPNAGNSGINLKDAADSGISLEDGGSDELEFELSLDPGNTPKPQAKVVPKAHAPAPIVEEDSSSEFELSMDDGSEPSDTPSSSEFELSIDEGADSGPDLQLENSDSEFELTLDDEGGLGSDEDSSAKDIFEETNFDVPALDDSGSEAVALDSDTDLEGSDFEISLEGSGDSSDSQVVTVDDDEADDMAATVAKPRKAAQTGKAKAKPDADEEPDLDFDSIEDSDEPAPKPKKGAKKKPVAAVDDDEDEDDDLRAPAAEAEPVEWGPLPAVLLFPTVIVLFIVGLMGFELIQGMWGYHRATPVGRPIIDNIARLFDDKIPKE